MIWLLVAREELFYGTLSAEAFSSLSSWSCSGVMPVFSMINSSETLPRRFQAIERMPCEIPCEIPCEMP